MIPPVTLHASSAPLVPSSQASTLVQSSKGNATSGRRPAEETMQSTQSIQICVEDCLKEYLKLDCNIKSRTIGWYEEGHPASYPIQVICRYLLTTPKKLFPFP